MTEPQGSKAQLASGSKAAVGRLFVLDLGDVLQRDPDDIEAVVDFGAGA